MQKYKLILASQSPRRRELLKYLNIPYTVKVSDVEEYSEATDPSLYVQEIALLKGNAIASKEQGQKIVLSADTVVVFKKQILEKPKCKDEAFETLKNLSGSTHEVLTGFGLFINDKSYSFVEATTVHFKSLTDEDIRFYLDNYSFLDKAGSYGIQEGAQVFVKKIEGCYNNVVGLPIARVKEELFLLLNREDNWRELFEDAK